MIYWHVERKSLCIHSQLKSPSSSEVASMIEGVLHHCTGNRPDIGRRLRRVHCIEPHKDDADLPLEMMEPAFKKDRQTVRLAIVGQKEVTDWSQPLRLLARASDWRERLRRHADPFRSWLRNWLLRVRFPNGHRKCVAEQSQIQLRGW